MHDRRRKRSQDPLVALHYQLAYARADGDLDAIVLSDGAGVVVAGVGAWAVCEELAAYAPILARRPDAGASLPERMAQLRDDVELRTVDWEGQSLHLCALAARSSALGRRDRSDPRPASATAHAAQGVTRILGTSP